jgi:bla regulator protein blaR1
MIGMIEHSQVIVCWLLTYLVHSTLLLGLVYVLDRSGRLRSGALLEAAWRAALFGAVVTTSLQSGLHFAPVHRELFGAAAHAPVTATANAAKPDAQSALALHAPIAPVRVEAPSKPDNTTASADLRNKDRAVATTAHWYTALRQSLGSDWPLALLAVWIAIAVYLLLRLLGHVQFARRELNGRMRLVDGVAPEILSSLCRQRGMRRVPHLSVSPFLSGPVSLPNGEISIPGWTLEELNPHQLRALLAHELAHCVRRDPQWLTAGNFVSALFWLQPLNRLACRRLAACAELACDDSAAANQADRRALAECLTECASRIHAGHLPTFASAMAGPGSAFTQRVTRLLQGIHSSNGEVSMKTRIAIVVALVAVVFVAPAFVVGDLIAAVRSGSDVSVVQTDNRLQVSLSESGLRGKMYADGQFKFDAAEDDLASLGDGDDLDIEVTRNGVTRRVTFTGTQTGIERRYYVNDKEQPFNAETRKWLAGVLPEIMRETAIDAKQRVARLYKQGGADAVLAEIDKIHSGYARSVYIRYFATLTTLPPAITDKLINSAAVIDSDYEKEQALIGIYKGQHLQATQLTALLKAASGIESDYEASQVLQLVAARMPLDNDNVQSYLGAAGHIGSDYELRTTLAALLARPDITPAVTTSIIATAVKHIGSSYDLRTVLTEAAAHVDKSDVAVNAYCQGAVRIGSSYDRREALSVLLEKAHLSDAGYVAVLDTAVGIDSSYDRSTLLQEVARQLPRKPALIAKYRAAAESIGDSYQRHQAEDALPESGQRTL